MVVVYKGSCHLGQYLVGGLAWLICPLWFLSNLLPFFPFNVCFSQDVFEALVCEQVDQVECWNKKAAVQGNAWNGFLRTEGSTAAERMAH